MAWLDTAEHYYDRQLWDLLNVTFSATNNSPPPIAGAKGSHSFGSREDCLIATNFNCDLNTSTYIHRCVEERDQRGILIQVHPNYYRHLLEFRWELRQNPTH